MRAALAPSRLFHHALTHDLVYCGFHKRGGDRLVVAKAVSAIRDAVWVGGDVAPEFLQRLEPFGACLGEIVTGQQNFQPCDDSQRGPYVAVPQVLGAEWPVDTPAEMGGTALHRAGFNGNAEMTREMLQLYPALELKSQEYAGTAVSWALFGSGNRWHRDTGDFVGTVCALLEAGAVLPPNAEAREPSDAVLEVIP
ncbi:MAG: hypothetical protein ACRD11_00345 [Terriglobia bacterium]